MSQPPAKFGLGQPVTRFEDATLTTGKGRYTDDVRTANSLYGYVLRSPVAHAAMDSLSVHDARQMPGVHAIYIYEDLAAAGIGDIPCFVPLENKDGTPRHDTPRPVLARRQVRYVGEPVAFVVAESLEQAKDAAEAIAVDYRSLPAVVDSVAATGAGAPQLHDHIAGNVIFDWVNGDAAATDKAFAEAHHVTKIDLINNRVAAVSMEPRNAIAEWDAAAGRVNLHTGSQGVHFVLDQLMDGVMRQDKSKVRVVSGNVGGGFGMKAFVYPEHALTTFAAQRLHRTVRWQSDRSEAFLSDNQGRAHRSFAELALDRDGHFLGVRVTTYADMGAYLSPFGCFVPTGSSALIAGLYQTPAISVNVKGICTNTTPVCAYRGAGRPEASYLMERLVDAAARDMGLAQDEIRRRNLIPPEALPYTTPLACTYDTGEFQAIMEAAMVKADWAGFDARRAVSEVGGKLRGIGMATYTERCGGGFPETAIVRLNDDETVTVTMGQQDYGTGLTTMYRMVMAEKLGLSPDRIELVTGDSDRTPSGLTGGSRGMAVGGSALAVASDQVIAKGREMAGEMLEAAAADIEFSRDDGVFKVIGTDRAINLFAVARAAKAEGKPLAAEYTHMPAAETFPNGCHIIEVEIDPDTGAYTLERYTIVDDFGVTMNPLLLAGQVHGGIVQGLGQAMLEQVVFDDDGQPLTGSFMDYGMPRADILPHFDFQTRNVPSTANPLGVKGAGEAGAIGAPPALIHALLNALHRHNGTRHLDMPATPERVWRACHGG